ncbi:MAG: hypothetical protein F7C32_03705 [Desulfurococcales archaeon]|nr:hypothetical protein [Desulfurococcales archaeon]
MCRLLAARAWTRKGTRTLAELAQLTLEAARNDPLLAQLGASDPRHCHGYGYTLLTGEWLSWTFTHEKHDSYHKSPTTACDENLAKAEEAVARLKKRLEQATNAFLTLHFRRASRGEPRGTSAAHPYLATIWGFTSNTILSLAHKMSRGEELPALLREGFKYVKRGYIVSILTYNNEEIPRLYLTLAHRIKPKDKARMRYYEPYIFKADGTAGMMSSTVAMLVEENGLPIEVSPAWGIYQVQDFEGTKKMGELPRP